MKTPFKSLVAATTGLLLLAASAAATEATAWSQLGFTIELSSGTLNITPAGTVNDATADWYDPAAPFYGSDAATSSGGDAFATAGSSTAISLALTGADNFFLVDAFALTDAIPTASSSAAALALAFYDLTFSNVVGATVTLTLTPAFYRSELSDAGGSFGYVSAFLSLGAESFLSFQDSGSNAGWADFAPITLTVGAGETVALSATVAAGTSVPEAGSTALFVAVALFGLAGFRRQLVRARVAA